MISVYLGDYHYKYTGDDKAFLTNIITGHGCFITGKELEKCNKSNKAISKAIEDNRQWLDNE